MAEWNTTGYAKHDILSRDREEVNSNGEVLDGTRYRSVLWKAECAGSRGYSRTFSF